MVMDRQLRGYYRFMNGIKYDEDSKSITDFKGTCLDKNLYNLPPFPRDQNPNDSHEDYDFSDGVLKYINQMLMEEDMEEKTCMFQESAALQAAEKSFYEVLGEKYPPSFDPHPIHYSDQSIDSPNEYNSSVTSVISRGLTFDYGEYESPLQTVAVDQPSRSTSQSFSSPSSSAGNLIDGVLDSPVSTLTDSNVFSDNQSVLQFKRGVEEASRFLPHDLGSNLVKVEKIYEIESCLDGSRGKKNPYPEELDLEEGRNIKQSATYTEAIVRSEMFDMVLLCNKGKSETALRESLQNGVNKHLQENGISTKKGSHGGKVRGKKQGGGGKREVVDLRTLLTLCAQSVAANDLRGATELLKQIRKHSSDTGDGMQRMAHYFANGLEARMAGLGTQSYKALITMPTSAAEVLKAYHLYLAICPFKKVSNFFANKTIMDVSEKATRLHIVDFGILYGFQYPCLIQRLSSRPGGPPKLRITGIDLPNSGFRPAERVEETGQRLANYAESFGVPFEFNAIAQKWETIQMEDLKLERDEVLVVNCQNRFRNLLDETVVMDSPREIVLNLIRKMNPDVYLQGVVNGSYNAPFFITRFREAIFHYSSLFDMLETNVPRETHERKLIEKQIFGWEAINVIACEGAERIERPETYKQWQVRNMRAGFKQLPLDREIMNKATERVNAWYHKDFVIDKDGHWMLLGWKGRIIYALSSWKPAY